MAATAGVIWLCECVRYWLYRGVGTCALLLNLVKIAYAYLAHIWELSPKAPGLQ